MKMKRLVSSLTAAALVATALSTSQVVFAEATFASASDFITDVVNTALAEVTSATKDDAIATMQSKLTTSGDTVLYDGAIIGCWYPDSSTTLYKDDTRTETLFTKSSSTYTVDPDLMKTLLTDINSDLVDTYTPTTSDWSKIIGKYDVTLGDITIPANQWIPAEIASNDKPITTNEVINLTSISGIESNANTNVFVMAYMIDNSGNLFLQNGVTEIIVSGGSWSGYYFSQDLLTRKNLLKTDGDTETVTTGQSPASAPYMKVGLVASGEKLSTKVYVANATNAINQVLLFNSADRDSNYTLLDVSDAGNKNISDVTTAAKTGIAYFTYSQAISSGTGMTEIMTMFDSNSASRQVVGNTTLAKRLAKLSALEDTDVLTITPTGWMVNGTTSIDSFMASQNMLTAGETADINAVAEIEPLSFNVVVPTTLPIYVATDGTVSTATNATVSNKSNAAVRITDVTITAKPTCGWTLVDDNPSDVRDAKEFTFETSLAANQILQRNEILPFTYSAELSPMTNGEDNLDLATVSVTVDWAD